MNLLTSLIGFSVCLLLIALAMILVFLKNVINRFRCFPETQERKRQRKLGRDAFLFLGSLILFFAGLAFFNFALFLQSYRTFAVGEPIAQVSIIASGDDQSFTVKVKELNAPLSQKTPTADREFKIKGDRWMLEGQIIRFQSWLSFLGFQPVYQLTRIQGSYYSTDDELKKERTVYSLVDKTAEEWWRRMYANAKKIPCMDLMYGSAVSQDARDESQYIITVLPSGFSLQKAGE